MNQKQKIVRGFLYVLGAALLAGGSMFFVYPDVVTTNFGISPLSLAGTAELRGFYGGGFFSFGLMTLIGLRCKNLGPGLLMAMAIFMWTVGVARAIDLFIDAEFAFTVPSMIAEFLVGFVYWTGSKSAGTQH